MKQTYQLERIVDLLQVPAERREQCVKDEIGGMVKVRITRKPEA